MSGFFQRNIVEPFNRWREINRIAEELFRLSDRELDDMGIARSRIWDIARASVQQS